MRFTKFVPLVLAGVLMTGGLAGAQGPGGPGMGPAFAQHRPPMERSLPFDGALGRFWNNPRIVEQLKLTDEQRKAMDGIMHDHRMKLIDLRANLERAEVAMEPLIKADAPDRPAIEAQIDKVVQARADLEKANARFLLDLRMQLKPEQWKQLQTMHRDRTMRERGGHGWGQGGPGPELRGPGRFRQPQAPPPPGAAPQAAPAPGLPPSGGGDQ